MQIIAEQKNVRQAPRKVRLVANQVKKMDLQSAVVQLGSMERRASEVILKVIKQAVANATKNNGLSVENLQLADIIVSDGMVLKRMRAASRGRGHSIEKRTCHIRVILENKQTPATEASVAATASAKENN